MFIYFIDYDIRMVYIKCQSLYVLQLEFNESKEKVIVFFKVSLEVIILDNFYINIIVFTMIDFFLSIFYYVVQKIYVFLMLEDGKWSRIFDFKLQSLISELEVGFGSVIRKQDFLFKGKGDNVDNLGSMKYIFENFCWLIIYCVCSKFYICLMLILRFINCLLIYKL